MATITRTIPIERSAEEVWDAVADVAVPHERLARGFVVATSIDDDVRTVTFDGGVVARELLVSVDHAARRVAYAVIESPLGLRHHHAVMEVVDDGPDRARLEWVVDASPDSAAPALEAMVDLGVDAMQRTLSGAAARA